MTAQICRESGPRLATPTGRRTACAPILRLAVAPGVSEVADTLPRALNADITDLITYRVQILNAAGRSAGDSRVAAFAASGHAPSPLEAFTARAGETGAILEWRRSPSDGQKYDIDISELNRSANPSQKETGLTARHFAAKREDPQVAPAGRANDSETHLHAPDTDALHDGAPGNELSGTVVSTARMGETYTFVANRVRPVTVAGHLLELRSEPTPPVTLTMQDTFPPRRPTGLATIPSVTREESKTQDKPDGRFGRAFIDLSWEPNTEPDLAGYVVYRQLARPNGDPQGLPARLTPLPISTLAYRDMAVKPAQSYIYSVTAVDASGNESPPSEPAQEGLPSPN